MNQNHDLAAWRVRGAAYLIDSVIPLLGMALFWFGVILAVGYGMGAGLGPGGAEPAPVWLLPLVLASAVVSVGYFVWRLIALKDGQTPGKKIVGIRAVRADTGETLGWGMMFVREFLVKSPLFSALGGIAFGIFGGVFGGIAQLFLPFGIYSPPRFMIIGAAQTVNLLWPLWDDKPQTLHDKIVGSCVIYNQRRALRGNL